MVLTVLMVVGAVYLVWLGVITLATSSTLQPAAEQVPTSWQREAAKGLGISGLNPKAFLLFLALLPQFTSPQGAWPLAAQIALLGVVHVASCAVVYTGVSASARVLRTRSAAAPTVTLFSGAAMVVIGISLLVEGLVAG